MSVEMARMAEERRGELNPDEFPSIEFIYEFALPSYDWAARRLVDTIERRFDHLLTLTFTLTLAVPVVTIAVAGRRISQICCTGRG